MPKLFRLTNKDGILRDVFEGVTINTPSMLCVEDYLDALGWVKEIGGIEATIARHEPTRRSSTTGSSERLGSSRWLSIR